MKRITLIFMTAYLIFASAFALEAKTQDDQPHYHDAHISQHARSHIRHRHWYNAKSGEHTSRFYSSMTMTKLNDLATKTINEGTVTKSKQGKGRKIYAYTFDKPIGRTSSGRPAKTLKVVTDSEGNVITAYPTK